MTQKEFEDRTRRKITAEDFELVQNLYMATKEMDKDEFCKEVRAMCAYDAANDQIELRRCLKEVGTRVGAMDAELNLLKKRVKSKHEELAGFLLGKACAYDDMDFYQEAVRLIGQRKVTLIKLNMNLPLWEEDKRLIVSMLEK